MCIFFIFIFTFNYFLKLLITIFLNLFYVPHPCMEQEFKEYTNFSSFFIYSFFFNELNLLETILIKNVSLMTAWIRK